MIGGMLAGFLAGAGGGSASGSYESIATVSVSSNTADISFTSIPSTYTHLQVRFINLQDATYNLWMQFNGDTGSNYAWHELYGDGATATAGAGTSATKFKVGYVGSTTASYAGASVVDILDYTNTNKYTTARALAGTDVNGSGGYAMFRSGLWMNTAAVTSIRIFPDSNNIKQYSHFALYGIKG